MRQVQTEEEFAAIVGDRKPTVAVFKASWCKDCHYIEPFMADVEEQYKEKLTFVHVDRDDFPDLCDSLQILGIPSFVVFLDGREIVRFVSKLRKTREEIEQFLDRAIAVADSLPQTGA